MQNDIDMLNNIRKTTENGTVRHNSVINYASDTELYRVLKQQQTEYRKDMRIALDRMLKGARNFRLSCRLRWLKCRRICQRR